MVENNSFHGRPPDWATSSWKLAPGPGAIERWDGRTPKERVPRALVQMLETHGGLNTSARHSGDQLYRLPVGVVAQQCNSTRSKIAKAEGFLDPTRCGTPAVPSVAPCQDLDLHTRNGEAQEHKGKEYKQKRWSGCKKIPDLSATEATSHLARAGARSGRGP